MTGRDVARYLLESCKTLNEFEPYMFGSSLNQIGTDFDILIVGPSGEPLSRLKEELKLAGSELPLDLLFMLPSEAVETNFIARERCVSLTELAKS